MNPFSCLLKLLLLLTVCTFNEQQRPFPYRYFPLQKQQLRCFCWASPVDLILYHCKMMSYKPSWLCWVFHLRILAFTCNASAIKQCKDEKDETWDFGFWLHNWESWRWSNRNKTNLHNNGWNHLSVCRNKSIKPVWVLAVEEYNLANIVKSWFTKFSHKIIALFPIHLETTSLLHSFFTALLLCIYCCFSCVSFWNKIELCEPHLAGAAAVLAD